MGNQQVPDVRVRLSADGVSEVVRAFQQVSAAAKKSGTESSKGFGLLSSALSGLKDLLPAIGVASAAAGIGVLVKDALSSAIALGQLSEKTGLSVETLSTLRVAATEADTDFDDLSSAVVKFNKTMGDLENGSGKAGGAVKRLLGSATALNGLNTDQRFEKVAIAIGKMPPGFEKTKAAMDFFGKSGAQMIPMLNLLATEGFDGATREAAKFGLLMSGDMVNQIKEGQKAINLLKLEAEGAALQFTAGLTPAVGEAVGAITTGFASDGKSGVEKLGEDVGTLVKIVTLGGITIGKAIGAGVDVGKTAFEDLVDNAKTQFALLVADAKGVGAAIGSALKGNMVGATVDLAVAAATETKLEADYTKRSKARQDKARKDALAAGSQLIDAYNTLFNSPSALPKETTGATGGGGLAGTLGPEASKAQTALQQQRLDNELALYKQYDALIASSDKQQYEQGLVSLGDYFDGRAAAINAGTDNEIDVLKRERDALAASPLGVKDDSSADQVQAAQINRVKELAALDAKIDTAKAGRQQQLQANDIERYNAELTLAQKRLQVEGQIKTMQGDVYGAAIDAINAEVDALKRVPGGLSPAEIEQWRQMQIAAANFSEAVRQGQTAVAGLGDVQAALENQVDSGQLFPFQAVQQYSSVVIAALPHLREMAAAQMAAATTPAEVQQAEQFANQIEHMAIAADAGAVRMGEFKKSVESSLTSNLTSFFSQGIDQARGFGDAMRLMAASVVDSLRQIASQMLATLITQKALSAAGGFFGSLAGAGAGSLGSTALDGFASGGPVYGPGTGTSDSIPARLSHGEFVVRAASVQQPGVLPLLAAINRGMGSPSLRSFGVPRFAGGGLVGMSDGSPADGTDHTLTVGLEDGLVAKHMATTNGRRVMLTHMANNPKAFKAALKL